MVCPTHEIPDTLETIRCVIVFVAFFVPLFFVPLFFVAFLVPAFFVAFLVPAFFVPFFVLRSSFLVQLGRSIWPIASSMRR